MYQHNKRNSYNSGDRKNNPPAVAVQVKFYEDCEKKILSKTLLDSDAHKQAGELHHKVNSSQIRKFFGEIKNLYLRMEHGRSWNELEPLFRMVKSKAWYSSKSNGSSSIPDTFRAFITDNIDRVGDEKDFKAFVLYFEAVLGFAYGMGLVNKN